MGNAGITARQVLDWQRGQEQARLGNAPFGETFESLGEKIRGGKKSLYQSGHLRFGDLDQMTQDQLTKDAAGTGKLEAELTKSNSHLSEIEKAVKSERVYK